MKYSFKKISRIFQIKYFRKQIFKFTYFKQYKKKRLWIFFLNQNELRNV